MKINKILFLFSLLILGGCKNLISDVEGLKVEPKLVLFGVISPEMDTMVVRVHKSWPLSTPKPGMYGSYSPVENATVKLKSSTAEAVLNYHYRKQAYIIPASQFPIEPGRTYRLEVTAPGGFEVWAECKVPTAMSNPLEVTKVDKFTSVNWFQERALSLRLPDIPGKGHFYFVELARRFRGSYPGGPSEGFDRIGFESGEKFLTDANKDGTYFLFRTFRFELWPPRDTLILYSALTDEHFFRYHQSVTFFSDDNPFGEPTPVYSNVVGGLGVFAACRERKEIFILE